MENSNMKKHVTVVGTIHIVFGSIGLIIALSLFFLFSFVRSMVGDDEVARMVLSIIGISFLILIGFLSTLGLIGGIGLLSYQSWARYLIIVVAILGLMNVPIGTLKGVYSLWVLLQDETMKLFDRKTV
jgi:hypothetical protein